jgi:hypothetical protein
VVVVHNAFFETVPLSVLKLPMDWLAIEPTALSRTPQIVQFISHRIVIILELNHDDIAAIVATLLEGQNADYDRRPYVDWRYDEVV